MKTNYLQSGFYGLLAIALLQIVYYYPQMPEVVASHFDGLGAANGWSSKNAFFGLYIAILLLLIAVFEAAPRYFETRLGIGRRLPNRDYWLAPGRIASTPAFLRRHMMLMGNLHLLLMIFAIQLAILANFSTEPRLHTSIAWGLGFYFVCLAAWLTYFILHFRKPLQGQ